MSDVPNSPLLTVDDVALRLACSTRKVYRLCDGGRMPHRTHSATISVSVNWANAVRYR
jgi:hypothetical protein